MNRQKLIQEFDLRPFGAKGWLRSNKLPCAWCGRSDKFGLILNDSGKGSYNCFHGSCGEKGPLSKLWKKIGRTDLLSKDDTVVLDFSLKNELIKKKIDKGETKEIKPPLGFKRIHKDDYLDSRGFLREQYDTFHVGKCIDPKFKHHLIFLIYENSKCVGFLGRTKFSKEWHKQNLIDAKKGLKSLIPRYQNAPGVDFEKIIGGYDEIILNKTHTVIVVEGLMDKQNVDKQFSLYSSDTVKCVFTFGNSISDVQIEKLYNKGVRKVYLMYDAGTIKQSQQFGLHIEKKIECFVCELKDLNKDPGDMSYKELKQVINDAYKPFVFKINKLPESELSNKGVVL